MKDIIEKFVRRDILKDKRSEEKVKRQILTEIFQALANILLPGQELKDDVQVENLFKAVCDTMLEAFLKNDIGILDRNGCPQFMIQLLQIRSIYMKVDGNLVVCMKNERSDIAHIGIIEDVIKQLKNSMKYAIYV